MTEGVFAGSSGPVYYPSNELAASVPYWNAKPVVVYHPSMYGSGWAGNPDVFNQQKVGTIFNTRFDGKRPTPFAVRGVWQGVAIDVTWDDGKITPPDVARVVADDIRDVKARGETCVRVYMQEGKLSINDPLCVYEMLQRRMTGLQFVEGELPIISTPPGAVN